MKHIALGFAFTLLAFGSVHADTGPFSHEWQELAPGVHVGVRPVSTRTPVMGTTTFVVGDDGVIVFDGGGVPRMSELVLEKIRSVTDKPVSHIVVSHWHQDHMWGIATLTDAFPSARVVAHPYTREQLVRRNPDAEAGAATVVERQFPTLAERLDDPALVGHDRERLVTLLADGEVIAHEYQRLRSAYPDTTFEHRMVIHQGSRTVELLHLGRGNTAGDIVMWLPDERIVATGDLVVRPTPYGFGSHPDQWGETLRALNALDYAVLVPGHGDAQRNTDYVDLLIETMELVTAQMAVLVAEGLEEAEAIERLDFSKVEPRFTDGDAFLAGRFRAWFKQPIGRAAYRVATEVDPEVPL